MPHRHSRHLNRDQTVPCPNRSFLQPETPGSRRCSRMRRVSNLAPHGRLLVTLIAQKSFAIDSPAASQVVGHFSMNESTGWKAWLERLLNASYGPAGYRKVAVTG